MRRATDDSLSRGQALALDGVTDPAPLSWAPRDSHGSHADATARLWAESIRQCVQYAAGRRGPSRDSSKHQQRDALEWIFSDSGPAADQRRLILDCLGIDDTAFREAAIRAGARPELLEDEPPPRPKSGDAQLAGWIADELRRREVTRSNSDPLLTPRADGSNSVS
jgi:hypothetical protein